MVYTYPRLALQRWNIQITRAGLTASSRSRRRVWVASMESLEPSHWKTLEEDTAVRAVSPPSVYPFRSILGTSHDASGEVFVFPLSPMSGKGRKPF
jgi:hypothetical protein